MSCGCDSGSSYDGGYGNGYNGLCNADTPYPSVSSESVPSLINNLIYALYGQVQKNVTNGQVTWTIPCDPSNIPATINNIPRNAGEGLLCYIIRALNLTTPSGFVTVNGVQTLTNKTLTAPVINSPTINNLTATGTLALPAGSITTTMIANGTIVPADLSTGGPTWDTSGNVGIGTPSPTRKLDVNGSITSNPTGVNAVGNIIISGTNSSGVVNSNLSLYVYGGDAQINNVYNGVLALGTNNVTQLAISAGIINAQGNPITSCPTTAKAWVNFNGVMTSTTGAAYLRSGTSVTVTTTNTLSAGNTVFIGSATDTALNGNQTVVSATGTSFTFTTASTGTASGTLAWALIIRSSYNVSSITKAGTGSYGINYATPLSDSNYSSCITISSVVNTQFANPYLGGKSSTSMAFITTNSANGSLYADPSEVSVQVFGN